MLAFDVGTSSVRTALFDARGARLEGTAAQRRYRLELGAPGQAELDARALLRATRGCLRVTLAARAASSSLAARPLAAVGASCFWHSLMGVDETGAPLTPIYTWADARSVRQARRLREQPAFADLHARTGCVAHTSYWPAKLLWLNSCSRAAFRRVRYWMSPGEWLYLRIAGVRAVSHSMASGTGLYDPRRLDFDEQLLAHCGLRRDRLMPLRDGAPALASGRLAALGGARWFAAIGDGAAGNIGSGASGPGTCAINLGSSAAVRVVRTRGPARAPAGLFVYRVDRERHLVGGAISNAGNLIDWCTRALRVPGGVRAVDAALSAERGPEHGLTVLPFWTAERAPTWRDDLSGSVLGLRASTTPADLLQAVTEAGFHRLAQIARRVPGLDARTRTIVSGGLSVNPLIMQRLADVTGRTLEASTEPEASLRGAAVHAWRGLGRETGMPPTGRRFEPDAARARAYRAARRRQAAAEELLT